MTETSSTATSRTETTEIEIPTFEINYKTVVGAFEEYGEYEELNISGNDNELSTQGVIHINPADDLEIVRTNIHTISDSNLADGTVDNSVFQVYVEYPISRNAQYGEETVLMFDKLIRTIYPNVPETFFSELLAKSIEDESAVSDFENMRCSISWDEHATETELSMLIVCTDSQTNTEQG